MEHTRVLEVRSVSKRLGKRDIIKNLSFEVNRGEIVGFLGPNGSGKTTSIRLITGMIKPDKGEIKVCGFNIHTEFTEAMKRIGAIVEQPALYGYLSGMENLLQAARISGERVSMEQVNWCVQTVQLQERISEKVQRYSLGMKQRLAIAQALLASPSLIILDEPTNGLDPAGIIDMRLLIRELRDKTGVSFFISSHLLSEMEHLCDRVIVIDNGETLAMQDLAHLQPAAIALSVDPEQLDEGVLLLKNAGFQPVIQDSKIILEMEKIKSRNQLTYCTSRGFMYIVSSTVSSLWRISS